MSHSRAHGQLIGEAVAGIVGVLIAVPTAALISEIVREYLIKPHTETASAAESTSG